MLPNQPWDASLQGEVGSIRASACSADECGWEDLCPPPMFICASGSIDPSVWEEASRRPGSLLPYRRGDAPPMPFPVYGPYGSWVGGVTIKPRSKP